jgi:hypothetical protein
MAIKYFQLPQNRPNVYKIYQDFSFQDPPKFTQIGIFGLKTNHLATLGDIDKYSASRIHTRLNVKIALLLPVSMNCFISCFNR